MIIIVGVSVSDVEMVIIICRFHKYVVHGACVHIVRRQVTLGVHSRCDSHVGRDQLEQIVRIAGVSA